MQVVPGGTYRIALELQNAQQVGPTWLVGAFASVFPNADILSVDEYLPAQNKAIVHVRWTRTTGEITEGMAVRGLAEGLILPAQMLPMGTVTGVEQTGVFVSDLESRIPNSVKLALAGGILLTTWYFAVRIKEKHGQSGAISS